MTAPHVLAGEAWEQFKRTAVSDGAEPHEIFSWAYMAGWAHDKWPGISDARLLSRVGPGEYQGGGGGTATGPYRGSNGGGLDTANCDNRQETP